MKIGITCYPTYGGSGVVATELGKKLAVRGHQVHFVSYGLPFRLDEFKDNLFFHEVEMVDYPLFDHPPYALALAAKMAQVSQQASLDIFHVHYAIPHAVSAFLAKEMLGSLLPRVVTTLHGTDILLVGRHPSFFDITRFALERSQAVTCVSQFLAAETRRLFALEGQLVVIPNFVDTSTFVPEDRLGLRPYFAPRGEKILLHLSNFRPIKRVEDVIRVFGLIARAVPSRLLMVGDGQQLPLAQRMVEEAGLTDQVVFLSRQRQVESLLPLADIFLVTSELESFGLAALEAMSCGVAVVGTICGGLSELVVSGATGFLCPVGAVEEMAQCCLKLLVDPSLLDQFKKAARQRAVELFDASKVVPSYERLYQQLLGQKP